VPEDSAAEGKPKGGDVKAIGSDAMGKLTPIRRRLGTYGRARIKVDTKTAVVAALVHCLPYIGFPRAVAAICAAKDL
jgi:4-carboxymuconolactone decarboxylase